jgi:lipoate-protein ligase A
MAIDEALLREVNEPVLRIYEWSDPAVSLGYFQPAALVPEGRSFVRRYTGGGLVDHARDVTYTLVLPRAHPWMELSAPDSYCLVHRGVQAAIAACGIESEIAPAASGIESEACFQKPVRFDIVAEGHKLGGAAQRRAREGLLHQGSILLPNPARNGALRQAFANAFASRLELTIKPSEFTAAETAYAIDLERERYTADAWNRMR